MYLCHLPLSECKCFVHQVVEVLMRHGANAQQNNTKGKSPLDIAATDQITKILRHEVTLSSSSACSSSGDEGGRSAPTSPESAAASSDKEEEDGAKHHAKELAGQC